MGSGALPLILLLMSFIRAGLTQERPKPVLKVTPDQRVFRGETVTLTCDIQPAGDIQWRYSWFKDGNTRSPYTTTTAEFSFTASVSDSGEYSCRGERSDSQRSDISAAVTLTVSDLPTSTLTVTPDSPVFTGETVNLTCVIESHSDWRQRNGLTNDRRFDRRDGWTDDWRYVWYKDSVMLQTSDRYTINRDTLTIRGATESDQGQYWCGGQRDKRPSSSHLSSVSLSVKAASSLLLVAGVVVGLLCLLIFISLLLLLWRYKKNKDQQRNINQTSVPNQSGESQPENSPLQSDPDHIYDDVTEVKKRHKDDPELYLEVIYSEVTVQKEISVDKDDPVAESNEVTYSEVRTKVKKCKSKGVQNYEHFNFGGELFLLVLNIMHRFCYRSE
ncbi:low affinity immunoglobulin gamma Fc region receptor II-like isoform X2 [Onychostoma macrolepis]|uniref:low affinity immunoglobulin gamma Fc region receptor II-like isoform X2 n=1 Tax=Onychostoma macrolepis TaxID=369639 RepID=UPI00272C1EA1|nr:low affinity immunoglobulin gamma Fc region receptor II-like isoform X2 [Onychostoma macrolepis]